MLGRVLTIFEGLRMDDDKTKWLAELLALSAEEKDRAIVGLVETIGRLEAAEAESQEVIDQMAGEIAEADAYAQALERSEEVRSANVDGLVAEMADLLKAENVGKAAEALETLRGIMTDAGVPMRGAETPKVSEFLATTSSAPCAGIATAVSAAASFRRRSTASGRARSGIGVEGPAQQLDVFFRAEQVAEVDQQAEQRTRPHSERLPGDEAGGDLEVPLGGEFAAPIGRGGVSPSRRRSGKSRHVIASLRSEMAGEPWPGVVRMRQALVVR